MNIYLIRHGETDWNAGRKWQGGTDIPLNAKGLEQARLVAERLKHVQAARVYSSPLSRALATAQTVADTIGAAVVVSDELREGNFGDWEGLPHSHITAQPIFEEWEAGEIKAPGGGESKRDALNRALPLALDIAGRETGDTIIATHSCVIRVVVNHILGLPIGDWESYKLPNGGAVVLGYAAGNLRVIELNG